ncbi:DNA processing protein DprA [Komagataeibacter rhaeticus]|uniref:DNA-processing protein DprA n=1 Tax=Komagataeibacter rhaeticus TaxID=215221 RepID=UPI0004D6561A|nr:DNA-processing protein DprA [Komagataeibacter rhaeticus]KDU97120.1 DNA polymerase III [Komagataeibacter rhaeticus AF1]MBL7240396.1 DNA-protecting protein DprA [Komagataeibacter rhaeticus]PYD53740.1 DNA processing protein DprA [Komagataeibacter rhaeticus]GBQ10446.1 DNA processing protein DprA [Komagataeibacter rhaeticus DSM 16663]
MTAPDAATLLACLRLARTDGIGPVSYHRLVRTHGSVQAALALLERGASPGRNMGQPGTRDDALREIDRLHAMGGQFVVHGQPGYPPLLAALHDAPPVLAVLGDPALLSARMVGIVGGRNASAGGIRMAESLSALLAAQGVDTVSGLARGIDAAAHRGAMTAGRTVAAIAGGLDCPYPPEHADLQARIAGTGAVVTEAPLGTVPQARHFPRRNRLIAGLGLGCVVIEAALRSGSLITARMALDYDRTIFAVPGSPLDPRSHGSNDLLRQGAVLTENERDILRELPETTEETGLFPGRFPPVRNPAVPQRERAGTVLRAVPAPGPCPPVQGEGDLHEMIEGFLSFTPSPVDDLVRRCQFSTAAVLTALSEMEIAGTVEFLAGDMVVRRPPPA